MAKNYGSTNNSSKTTTNFKSVAEAEDAMKKIVAKSGYELGLGERGRMQNGIFVLQLTKDGKQVTALVLANGYARVALGLKKDMYIIES